ncbi:MAG: tRNA (guanosine(46)-N7)-methyltransferase TrmB [Firmicutes bacterium]|nr:tRNA (guanosine(46)-N7)-methyltransferase TrmB [Bacillota bacterium]
MRMRKKRNFASRIQKCADYLVSDPASFRENGIISAFPDPDGEPARKISLEIGCGKGEFITSLSAAHPDGRFVAIERIADVALLAIEKYADAAGNGHPDNVRFIIGNAADLESWFSPDSISEIYLNFSDPWPKKGHSKRRLTYRDYLLIYSRILKVGGGLHIKTDNDGFFEFTLEELAAAPFEIVWMTRNLHESEYSSGNILTEYERKFSDAGAHINALYAKKRGDGSPGAEII